MLIGPLLFVCIKLIPGRYLDQSVEKSVSMTRKCENHTFAETQTNVKQPKLSSTTRCLSEI